MSQGTDRLNDALPWIDLEQQLRNENPRQWAARFDNASPNECDQLLIVLTRHTSNTQIRRLFEILEKGGNHEKTLQKWRATLTRLSPNLFRERTRFQTLIRQRESHWLLHYKRVSPHPARPGGEPAPAIIGFTGNAGLLMAPIPCVLAALAQTPYDVLVVRRRYRQTYFSDDGQLLRSIREQLQAELKERLLSSIVLGTSSGGLAGLCMAHSLGIQLGIAIGAAANANTFLLNSPVIHAAQRPGWAVPPWRRTKTRLLLTASGDNQADQESAVLISDHFNHHHRNSARATALLFPRCSRHNLPEDLSLMGITFDRLLLPLIHQDLSALPTHQRHPERSWTPAETAMEAQNQRPRAPLE